MIINNISMIHNYLNEELFPYKCLYEKYVSTCLSQKQEVTVFLLTHNRHNYLKIMLESVLKQTYTNYQLVILDNMSSDETEQLINAYIKSDDRIIYVKRKSILSCSNFCFSFIWSFTEYTIVLHDDDYVDSTYLESMIFAMKQNNNSIACLSSLPIIIDSNGNYSNKAISDKSEIMIYSNGDFTRSWLTNKIPVHPCCPSIIYLTSFYKNISNFMIYDAGPAADILLYFQTEKNGGSVGVLEKTLYYYRIHNKQDSYKYKLSMDLKLLHYLYKDQYYSKILSNIIVDNLFYYKNTLRNILKYYSKRKIKRAELIKCYKLIPKQVKKCKEFKKHLFIYRITCIFPKLISYVYNKKIKNIYL